MPELRFLQPLHDLLHAASLDERRCVLCHIPFSPSDPGEAQLPESSTPSALPLCPACRLASPPHGRLLPPVPALLRPCPTRPRACAENA